MARRTNPSACTHLEADLVLLHYGDLADAERHLLETHVKNCAGCAAYVKELASLLPLTVRSDDPPQEFWVNYNRELQQKIDAAAEKRSWWLSLGTIFQPRYVPAFAAAAVVALALAFTLSRGIWPAKNTAADDELAEALPVAENLEFFSTLDVLDDLDLLEFIRS